MGCALGGRDWHVVGLMQPKPPLGIARLLQRSRRKFNRGLRFTGFLFRPLPLVVMPLDGEKHARAKHEHLEGNEDYRDPIQF